MIKKNNIIKAITSLIIIISINISIKWYKIQLKPANEKMFTEETIEIQQGMNTKEILQLLYEKKLIKNVFAGRIYIKLNKIEGLQAGKYTLNSKMTLEEILAEITSGNIIDEQISITFLEGKNMRWIAKEIADKTENTEQDVYNLLEDEEYIKSLINKYWFLTDEIMNENVYYPLEGYLYPETYRFENKNISVEEIFKVLLDQTDTVLGKYKNQIEQSGITVHQILTIASIIELEGNDSESRIGISGVILNRLKSRMSIGSDVTTYYAIKVDVGERDLYSSEINEYNPYNTRGPNMEGKLPIGPISSISEDSLKAALNPEDSEYLYFVADMNGKIYFSTTYEQHLEMIEQLQKQGLWYEY